MSDRRVLSVNLPGDLWRAFCAKAAGERLSPSTVAKRLIREYVGESEVRPLPE